MFRQPVHPKTSDTLDPLPLSFSLVSREIQAATLTHPTLAF